MTYAQKNKKKKIDWNILLDTDFNNHEEWIRIISLSVAWSTCPVGQTDIGVPRTKGKPDDELLVYYGMTFASYVRLIAISINEHDKYSFDYFKKLAKQTVDIINNKTDLILYEKGL